MEGKPWLFDNHLHILKPFDGFTSHQMMKFDREDFWVQINNLPLACMTRDIGFQIGATVGAVKDVDIRENGIGWGKYLRVKIEIDLQKMVARGRTSSIMKNKIWVPMKYVKLPKLCFKCGKMIYGGRGCSSLEGNPAQGNGGTLQYGLWLRATHTPRQRNSEKQSNYNREIQKKVVGSLRWRTWRREGVQQSTIVWYRWMVSKMRMKWWLWVIHIICYIK